jgi:hypothetical protein
LLLTFSEKRKAIFLKAIFRDPKHTAGMLFWFNYRIKWFEGFLLAFLKLTNFELLSEFPYALMNIELKIYDVTTYESSPVTELLTSIVLINILVVKNFLTENLECCDSWNPDLFLFQEQDQKS